MADKTATPDHPILDVLKKRWSPYIFADKPVSATDLQSLFEAARWAPSSYNEQPWSYIVATKDDPEQFAKVLSCLVEGNQAWAKDVPVLALGVITNSFKLNGKPNKAAQHDLGLASSDLVTEATSRGLYVHQMIGILPDKARAAFQIPEGSEALTGIAIGYAGDSSKSPEALRQRDEAARKRKPLAEFVFAGKWGSAAPFLSKK
jgi:nitroreductase